MLPATARSPSRGRSAGSLQLNCSVGGVLPRPQAHACSFAVLFVDSKIQERPRASFTGGDRYCSMPAPVLRLAGSCLAAIGVRTGDHARCCRIMCRWCAPRRFERAVGIGRPSTGGGVLPYAALSELWLVCISTVPHRRMKWTHDRHGRVQNAIGETYRRRIIPMTNSKA